MSVLEAANRESVRAVETVQVGIAAIEAQVPRARTICGTRPIEAAGANNAERTTAADAVARHRQFERRGKSGGCIITAPALSLSFPLGIGRQPVAVRARVVDAIDPLPQVIVLWAAPVVWAVKCQNKITVTRLVAAAQG